MGTKIRAEISTKNKYWIDKHRYYELKHFCLQYPMWKKEYTLLEDISLSQNWDERVSDSNISNPTDKIAIARRFLSERIEMVERAAKDADEDLYSYILKGVTEELSYSYLKVKLQIPCGKDMYYDRYRRFFWLLSNSRL